MSHPEFFNAVPTLRMYDPLAEFLGAADEGVMEYGYYDAVRLAGHSCPTVAAAFGATCRALAFLYPDSLPVRGVIRVEFRNGCNDGVTGVIANVASLLTGAMDDKGFKGLGGRFDRREKLLFNVAMPTEMRFTRLDTDQSVQVSINLQRIPASPQLPALMSACLSGTASPAESVLFRQLWQERVRLILQEHLDDPAVFSVTTDESLT